MAKTEFVLNVGDDNVVLTKFTGGKVANAWLGSPDPAMATEELGEALAEDKKARISVLFDTLDQSFKEEEIPRVGILDRRKVLARHINMAFPGANIRGARLVNETSKKTLVYEFASVPLDGHIPGWLDFVDSLPNPLAGIHAIATENVDILDALLPKDLPVEEGRNHWRHLIGVNVTGGLRQIIAKNGRLSLTRLTQAPPPETPPDEFSSMIIADFKATITYIRRLGYQVGEPLDLVVLTTAENKVLLQERDWDGARSVSVYTPYEAGAMLGLGSLGREDQAFADVLHAAWFASKRKSLLPLTRAAALGDTKDDLRDLGFALAPYAAGIALAGTLGWSGWTYYNYGEAKAQNAGLIAQLDQVKAALQKQKDVLAGLPYQAGQVKNVIDVAGTLDVGKVNMSPLMANVAAALDSDAIVLDFSFKASSPSPTGKGAATPQSLEVSMRLAKTIANAEEAVQTARRLNQRLTASFGPDYKVTMTKEPVGAQAAQELSGGIGRGSELGAASAAAEVFYASYRVEKVTK